MELVLEGRARAGVPVGDVRQGADDRAAVTVVHAPGEGDDEIVRRCTRHAAIGHAVSVATADRGLLARLLPLGVIVVGPRTLRDDLLAW